MSYRRRAILCWLSISIGGCTIQANLHTGYRPGPAEAGVIRPVGIAVKRFEEKRPPRVYTTLGRGFSTYIPFLPYVAMPYERLDENARKAGEEVGEIMPPFEQYTYPASMARAVADDLRASQRFARVDYVGNEPADGYHYILTGQVRASPIEKDLTSYGLGAAGVLLWFLPIPNGQIWASLTLDLVLTDSHSGREVWKVTLQPEMAQWTSLYTSSPTLVYGGVSSFDFPLVPSEGGVDRESLFSWHFELLRRAMADIPKQIAAATKD